MRLTFDIYAMQDNNVLITNGIIIILSQSDTEN